MAPTFGGKDIDPAVAIPVVASRIAERRSDDIERGLGLGRAQVIINFPIADIIEAST